MAETERQYNTFQVASGLGIFSIALLAIWIALELHTINDRARTVALIEATNGTTGTYDPIDMFDLPLTRLWDFATGNNSVWRPTSVSVFGDGVGMELLSGISRLSTLESLNATDGAVTDEEIVHIARLRGLRALGLGGNRISDNALPQLVGLQKLQWLRLGRTAVTDSGMSIVGQMKELRVLELDGTQITDSGLRSLRDLEHLECLHVHDTAVTAEGQEGLKHFLPKLQIYAGRDSAAEDLYRRDPHSVDRRVTD